MIAVGLARKITAGTEDPKLRGEERTRSDLALPANSKKQWRKKNNIQEEAACVP